jgi:hypothetical protein
VIQDSFASVAQTVDRHGRRWSIAAAPSIRACQQRGSDSDDVPALCRDVNVGAPWVGVGPNDSLAATIVAHARTLRALRRWTFTRFSKTTAVRHASLPWPLRISIMKSAPYASWSRASARSTAADAAARCVGFSASLTTSRSGIIARWYCGHRHLDGSCASMIRRTRPAASNGATARR